LYFYLQTNYSTDYYKQNQVIQRILSKIKKDSKKLQSILVLLQKESKLSIKEKDIIDSFTMIMNNKLDRYTLHKEIKNEQSLQYIAKGLGKIFAT